MSYNIRVIECPNNPEHRLEPLLSGRGYSEWLCLDCGEVIKENYLEEEVTDNDKP